MEYFLAPCHGVLQGIGRGDIYNDHLELLTTTLEKVVRKRFFTALATLPPEYQQMCFDSIVDKLREASEEGFEWANDIIDHLLEGTNSIL